MRQNNNHYYNSTLSPVNSMPESDVMTPEESISKSILEKPLHQLTEDDISQLTREDCRRYLKDKGTNSHFSIFQVYMCLISSAELINDVR